MEVDNTTQEIIKKYKDSVSFNKKICKREVIVEPYFFGFGGDSEYSVTLNCWELDPNMKIFGFRTTEGGFQYDLRNFNATRPKAWRIPFLEHPDYYNPEFTVSHLCHNNRCYNWNHHELEPLAINKARNGCPGGNHCHHRRRCIIPGPYYNY